MQKSGLMRANRAALASLTGLAMLAFAANSLLARLAFQSTAIDAASFTAIRLVTGALTLLAILRYQGLRLELSRTACASAALLFAYAAPFSFAYRSISTGAGALVLFTSAQLVMIGYGLVKGERASTLGLLLAVGGMVAFLLPSASSPPVGAAALMALAGCAWGGFSLLGRTLGSPIVHTATSFVLAAPLALVLVAAQPAPLVVDGQGASYAALSGALASALGYALWYWVRSRLSAISAGAVQLSVPLISAVLGILLLGESMTWLGAAAALMTLGGVALVTLTARRSVLKR